MSDKEIREMLLSRHQDSIEQFAVDIATFCIVRNIPLDKGLEISTEIVADLLKCVIKSGAYDRGKAIMNELKKKDDEELKELQRKMREAADE